MIWFLQSDIIPGDVASTILRNNAKMQERKEKWILLKDDGLVTSWHWMVTEWSLECTCHSVDWMVTERWLNDAFQFSRIGGISACESQAD